MEFAKFKYLKTICIVCTYMLLCNTLSINALNAQNKTTSIEYIKSIDLYFYGIVFDAYFSREEISTDFSKSKIRIQDTTEIKRFFLSIDTLQTVSPDFLSPFCNSTSFVNIPNGSPYFTEFTLWDDLNALAIVNYSDGQLPELIWFGMYVNRHNFLYRYNPQVMSYLSDLMNKYNQKGIVHIDSEPRSQDSLDTSGIKEIHLIMLDGDNINTPLTRSDFVRSIYKRKIFKAILITSEYGKSLIMNSINNAKFIETLPYNATNPAIVAHYGENENLVWDTISSKVIGQILVSYKSNPITELIWITDDYIERGYFRYEKNEQLNSVLSDFMN